MGPTTPMEELLKIVLAIIYNWDQETEERALEKKQKCKKRKQA